MSEQCTGRGSALELVAAAITAKVAEGLGAPRLALRAATRARTLAGDLVLALAACAERVSEDAEDAALTGVRVTGDLAALLNHDHEDLEETP